MKLHLGVIDFPTAMGQTTGDVAEILEAKYHIMATFFAVHSVAIMTLIEESLVAALEARLAGAPGALSLTSAAESAIGALFRQWIASRGMDGLAPGVPTKAAMNGVSHRFKSPYEKRGPRPSFVDTGTYVAAFTVWADDLEGALVGAGQSGLASLAPLVDLE